MGNVLLVTRLSEVSPGALQCDRDDLAFLHSKQFPSINVKPMIVLVPFASQSHVRLAQVC